MKEAILDTSFILTCVRNKVDFFEKFELLGIKPLIPNQVLREIERITKSNKKQHFRDDAKISLEILKKENWKEINLKQNSVDKGIKKFSDLNKDVLVATLDEELRNKISNQKIIIRKGKNLEIIN